MSILDSYALISQQNTPVLHSYTPSPGELCAHCLFPPDNQKTELSSFFLYFSPLPAVFISNHNREHPFLPIKTRQIRELNPKWSSPSYRPIKAPKNTLILSFPKIDARNLRQPLPQNPPPDPNLNPDNNPITVSESTENSKNKKNLKNKKNSVWRQRQWVLGIAGWGMRLKSKLRRQKMKVKRTFNRRTFSQNKGS